MVKTTGPAVSLDAGGSLAQQVTFSKWKGKTYLKQFRKPRQPRTDLQRSMRAMMSFLSRSWAGIPAGSQATWDGLARANNVSPFNAFQAHNLERWREFLWPSQAYPWTGAGVLSAISGWNVTTHPQAIRHSIPISIQRDGWAIPLFYHRGAFGANKQEYLYHIIVQPSAGTYLYVMRHLTPGGSQKLHLTLITTTGKHYTPGLSKTETVPP